jgi:IclR helix-turn-helix domain
MPRMPNSEPHSISIKLSPTQVDDVVRAASHSRAPSISSLIADTLRAPATPAGRKSGNGRKSTKTAAARLSGYMPIGAVDPRLSRSLLRGLSILTCFGPDGGKRGIVEIAHTLRMSPSTTHRYVLTLVELGLLERCPTTRKYSLPWVSRV